MNSITKLLNFSELSRYITGGDRNAIRPVKIPRKWHKQIDQLIYTDLPKWWEQTKTDNKSHDAVGSSSFNTSAK